MVDQTPNRTPDWTRPFVLAVFLCALGLAAWWLEFQRKPQQEAQAENAKKPFVLPKNAAITDIKLESGPRAFEWKCLDDGGKGCKQGNNSKWEMETPLKVRADDANVNSLVSAIDRIQATDTFDLKEETPEKRARILKEYGLSPSDLKGQNLKKFEIQTASDGTWVGYFGGSHPINDGIFTIVEHTRAGKPPLGQPDETKVFLTPSFFKVNFDHDLSYWRDKKLLTLTPSEVTSFKLEGKLGVSPPAGTTWVEGVKDGSPPQAMSWTLKSPSGEFAGDTENIDNLLSAVSTQVAKSIPDEDKSSLQSKALLKGAHPLFTLTLHRAASPPATVEPPPITISLFEKTEEKKKSSEAKNASTSTQLYATVSNLDPLFELQNGARNQLGKTLKDLRLSRLIHSSDRFGAKKIEFSGSALGSSPLTLTNQNAKWSIAGANPGTDQPASDAKVQSSLDKLSGNRIQDFLPPSKTPSVDAGSSIQMTLWTDNAAGSEPQRKIQFWKAGGKLYARDLLSKQKDAFVVDTAVQDGLPSSREFFKATQQVQSPVPKK